MESIYDEGWRNTKNAVAGHAPFGSASCIKLRSAYGYVSYVVLLACSLSTFFLA